MSAKNKAVVRRIFEESWNNGDVSKLKEIIAANHFTHGGAASALGPENVAERVRIMHTALPDIRYEIEDIVAEGDKVVVRFSVRGTQKGEFRGIAATGNRLAWEGIVIYLIIDGKITEEWVSWDLYGIMEQLGAIPSQ